MNVQFDRHMFLGKFLKERIQCPTLRQIFSGCFKMYANQRFQGK